MAEDMLATRSAAKMSERGWATVEDVMPRISGAVADRAKRSQGQLMAPIDLSTAENWLLRKEVLHIVVEAISGNLETRHFSYPSGFGGDVDLTGALAAFFNARFAARLPVQPSHIVVAPGATNCLETLLHNVCDPGDGVLIPAPFWNAFDIIFRARCLVDVVPVNVSPLHDTLTLALIPALTRALEGAKSPIKALVLTNPHNPLGQCYPRRVLEACAKFCQQHDIHYISDEIYALTHFDSPDVLAPTPFVSALSLDLHELGCQRSRMHVVWSTSKDFGQSGVRLGCTVTQANKSLHAGLTLASSLQVSSLTAVAATALIRSSQLDDVIRQNSMRLARACGFLTHLLQRYGIPYFPCYAGLYLFVKLAPDATTWEDESHMVQEMRGWGLSVSGGRAYHVGEDEKGWARITFALEETRFLEALNRLESYLFQRKAH